MEERTDGRAAAGAAPVDEAKRRDAETLASFIAVYCAGRHGGAAGGGLCAECAALLAYARERLARCPMNPKPKCKDCPVHCYRPDMRARIREVMRYAGMRAVLRGRIDWLFKYFLR